MTTKALSRLGTTLDCKQNKIENLENPPSAILAAWQLTSTSVGAQSTTLSCNGCPNGRTGNPLVTHPSHKSRECHVLTLGQGDVGQLGLGEDIYERKRPALVPLPDAVKGKIVEAVAGGMHTVCLSSTGEVIAIVISLSCFSFTPAFKVSQCSPRPNR